MSRPINGLRADIVEYGLQIRNAQGVDTWVANAARGDEVIYAVRDYRLTSALFEEQCDLQGLRLNRMYHYYELGLVEIYQQVDREVPPWSNKHGVLRRWQFVARRV